GIAAGSLGASGPRAEPIGTRGRHSRWKFGASGPRAEPIGTGGGVAAGSLGQAARGRSPSAQGAA
ncbi:MAG: hypothetical protein WAV20_18965, partial [Blastocatellia bacterium]